MNDIWIWWNDADRWNRITVIKTSPVPLGLPQTPRGLVWNRTWTYGVKGRTACPPEEQHGWYIYKTCWCEKVRLKRCFQIFLVKRAYYYAVLRISQEVKKMIHNYYKLSVTLGFKFQLLTNMENFKLILDVHAFLTLRCTKAGGEWIIRDPCSAPRSALKIK